MIPYIDDRVEVTRDLNEAIKISKSFNFEQVRVQSNQIEIKDNKIHIQNVPFKVSRMGISNLCDALKIPDPFAVRIPTDLFITNVNRLAQEQASNLIDLYFTADEILIDSNYRTSYEPIPNHVMLETISEQSNSFDFSNSRFMFENHKLKIELAGEGLEIEKKGDINKLGCMISHYPTNKSMTLGNYMIWTVACTNGMLLGNEFGREKLINKTTREIKNLVKNFIGKLIKFPIDKEVLRLAIEDLKKTNFVADDFVKLYKRLKRISDAETAQICMGKDFNQELLSKAEKLLDDDEGQTEIDCLKYNTLYAVTDYGSNSVKSATLSKKLQKIGGQILLNQLNKVEKT